MEEKRIEDMLEEEVITEDDAMDKKIRKNIFMMTYGRILLMLAVLGLLAAGIYYGIDRYREAHSFHLSDLPNLISEERNPNYYDPSEKPDKNGLYGRDIINLGAYLETWVNLNLSSYHYLWVDNVIRDDYGEYSGTVYLGRNDYTKGTVSPNKVQIPFFIKDGKLEIYMPAGEDFFGPNNGTDRQETIEEIENLPDSAIVTIDVLLTKSLSAEQFMRYYDEFADSSISYLYIDHFEEFEKTWTDLKGYERHSGNIMSLKIGFSVFGSQNGGYFKYFVDDPYYHVAILNQGEALLFNGSSSLSVRGEDGAKLLTRYFQSHLKLMLDSGLLSDEYTIKCYQYLYDHITEDGMDIKGFRIFATKADALKIAQNTRDYTYVTITDVKSSIYEKR